MKKCELKVVKFSKGVKVYEEVLGDVMVFEGRISSKVWEKWHKIITLHGYLHIRNPGSTLTDQLYT